MATKKKAVKGKKSKPKGNGGIMSKLDMSTYTRDTKHRAASGRAAWYKVRDFAVKLTIGLSGTALYKAAAEYLAKKLKRAITYQMIAKRYSHLAPGPQTMAIRALMRGGGKALIADMDSPRKKTKPAAKKTKPAAKKTKAAAAPAKKALAKGPKLPIKKAVAPKAKVAKAPRKQRALKTKAPATPADPAQEVAQESLAQETVTNNAATE